ncbi:MAG: CDP-glucose 4,6-dehydratase [Pseudomonadota bacterium]
MDHESRVTRLPDPEFWKDRRVLVTGHTGFKGAWLALWLADLGADVTGIALPPETDPSLFQTLDLATLIQSHHVDIRDPEATHRTMGDAAPDIVLHLAAQSLVRRSYREPLVTFSTNVMGTAHILDGLRTIACARAAVIVTTDKVYRNREWNRPYTETDDLGGHDPYSGSKAASELVVDSYRKSFLDAQGVRVASARAGNVIGGGDWADDRLLPDIVRAWSSGQPVNLRRPRSTRPWQHVLEPVCGYLVLAEALTQDAARAGPYNFGPAIASECAVEDVVRIAADAWRLDAATKTEPIIDIAQDATGPHEAGLLALDPAKSANLLQVNPVWTTEQAVQRTIGEYAALTAGQDARAVCRNSISAFMHAANSESEARP